MILSSLEVIKDLFEKRSSNYSDRKEMTMLNKLYVLLSFLLLFKLTFDVAGWMGELTCR